MKFNIKKISSTDIIEARFQEEADEVNIEEFLNSEYSGFQFSWEIIDVDENHDSESPFIYVIRVEKNKIF